MSIFDSNIAPYLFVIAIFGVLAGFARKILLKVIIILVVEVALFALFPHLLLGFTTLVSNVHHAFTR